jgi:gamma-glutamyltranspeptidase/glutathione hydrolase
VIIGLILTVCLSWLLHLPTAATPSGGTVAQGHGGAVTSVDRQATQIGLKILQAGGNAVDAAVATAAALGVTEPFSAGIGGGGFMLIYLKASDRVITLDGRETAPAAVTPELFNDPDKPGVLPFAPERISSGRAVGVPGTLLTWAEALSRYGTLSLAQALTPAANLAEQGFAVNDSFAQQVKQNQQRFTAFRSTQALYLPNGQPPAVGTWLKNPDLAKTYRLIAKSGVNSFYRGEIGEAIVQTVQKPPTVAHLAFRVFPGQITLADLDSYNLRVRPAVTSTYRGYRLYGMGLPSSGAITISEALNIAAGFNLADLDRAQAWHRLIEAERLAFADRNAYLGDPEFVDVPVTGLLSAGFAAARRAQISDYAPTNEKSYRASAGNPFLYQQDPSPSFTGSPARAQIFDHEGQSTTHLTVTDRFGNIVSYTLTIEATGGSGMVVPGYGFLLNNELTDFDPISPHPNCPEPGKRPRSSMAPTLAFAPDGRILAFGSPGGATIIGTVMGIAVNLIDFQLDLPTAIAAPRLSQRNSGATQVDGGLETSAIGHKLLQLGHELESVSEIGAATGLVVAPDGWITAAAEPTRRGGGYAMVVSP